EQFAAVEAGELEVQVHEAGGQAGHAAGVRLHLVDEVERVVHQLADRLQISFALLLREVEDLPLGLVEELFQRPGFGSGKGTIPLAAGARRRRRALSLTIFAYCWALAVLGTTRSSCIRYCGPPTACSRPRVLSCSASVR